MRKQPPPVMCEEQCFPVRPHATHCLARCWGAGEHLATFAKLIRDLKESGRMIRRGMRVGPTIDLTRLSNTNSNCPTRQSSASSVAGLGTLLPVDRTCSQLRTDQIAVQLNARWSSLIGP